MINSVLFFGRKNCKYSLKIKSFLKNNNLETGVNQNNALLIWESVVGKKVGQNTTPEKVEHGVLVVKVKNATWRQELVFEKQNILKLSLIHI